MDALNPIRPEDLGPILLLVNNIEVVYHDVIQVLRGVSLKVPEGRITALLGPNGAGKTTTLRAISGLLIPEDGEVVRGEILFRGTPIQGRPPRRSSSWASCRSWRVAASSSTSRWRRTSRWAP